MSNGSVPNAHLLVQIVYLLTQVITFAIYRVISEKQPKQIVVQITPINFRGLGVINTNVPIWEWCPSTRSRKPISSQKSSSHPQDSMSRELFSLTCCMCAWPRYVHLQTVVHILRVSSPVALEILWKPENKHWILSQHEWRGKVSWIGKKRKIHASPVWQPITQVHPPKCHRPRFLQILFDPQKLQQQDYQQNIAELDTRWGR